MDNISFKLNHSLHSLKDASEVFSVVKAFLPEELAADLQRALDGSSFQLADFLTKHGESILARVPAKYQFLFTKLGSLETQTLDLIDYTKSTPKASALELGVTVASKIFLDRITTDELENYDELGLNADEVLIRLGFAGNVALRSQVNAATGILKAGLEIDAETDQGLAYSLKQNKNNYPISFLPVFSKSIVNPLDLGILIEAMQKSQLVSFERTGLTSALVGLDVGLTNETTALFRQQKIGASAGATFSFEYKDKSRFSLVLKKLADGAFVLELNKERSTGRSTQLKLGADVTLKGFKNGLLEDVTKALSDVPGLKSTLDKLDGIIDTVSSTSIHEALRQELAAKWSHGEKVFNYLFTEDDTTNLASRIQNELLDKIEELLNVRINVWSSSTQEAATGVVTEIAEALGISGSHLIKLDEYLNSAISEALAAGRKEIDSKIEELIKQENIKSLLEPWKFLGDEVNKAISAFSKSAPTGLVKVKSVLELIYKRYTTLRQKLIKVIKDDVEEKIAIEIISNKNRTQASTCALRIHFIEATPSIQAIYHALWTTDLHDLPSLVKNIHNENSKNVTISGEYSNLLQETVGTQLSINFLGLKLSSTSLFASEVELALNTEGQLLVARSKAELSKSHSRFSESQRIELKSSMDFLHKNLLERPPVTLKLTVVDARFKPGSEVDAFFGVLEANRLMRSGARDDVRQALFPFGGNKKPIEDAKLALNIVLGWKDWLRLLATDLAGAEVQEAWRADQICNDFLSHVKEINPRCHSYAREFMESDGTKNLLDFLLVLGRKNQSGARSFVHDFNSSSRLPTTEFSLTYRLATAVSDLYVGLMAMQRTWLRITGLLPLNATQRLPEQQSKELQKQLFILNEDFNRTFSSILSTGYILDDPGKVSWLTLAALRLLISNTQIANTYLSCTFESDRTGKVIFS